MANENIMKYNRKGWVAKDFMLALLIFSAGIALYFVMVTSLANDYGTTSVINETFNNNFNKFNETTAKASGMLEVLTSGGGLNLVDATELIFAGTFSVINLVLSSVSIATSQVLSFGTFFGIPTEISTIFLTFVLVALTISIVFIIINSVRGGKEI